jgi:3-oxoacyl-[acyl-carrier protein] reductase
VSGLLEGKVVLITAAAGAGIGFATARRCIEHGATVVLNDVHAQRLAAAAETLGALAGVPVVVEAGDVAVESDVQRLWQTALAAHGRVDVLVNNAARAVERAIVDMTDEEWQLVLDVSLTGTFRCLRAALRYMLPRRSGAIVNLASVLGWRAQTLQSSYSAAKAGVMALTRCAALEAAPAGVRVNAVAPSLAANPFLVRATNPDLLEELTRREPFGRAATPEEIANVIIFLASDLSSYMTGEVVSVSSQHP